MRAGSLSKCDLSPPLQYINENHENPIYLPGISLGENVVASSNLVETVSSRGGQGEGTAETWHAPELLQGLLQGLLSSKPQWGHARLLGAGRGGVGRMLPLVLPTTLLTRLPLRPQPPVVGPWR